MEEKIKMDIYESISDELELTEVEIKRYSPLALAFIGDCVYELMIRTIIISDGNAPVNKLNKKCSDLAMAKTQAEIIKYLKEELSEEEEKIFKRGLNSKPQSKAKNATFAEYKYATGFECLIGYLYLSKQTNRAMQLVKKGINYINLGGK